MTVEEALLIADEDAVTCRTRSRVLESLAVLAAEVRRLNAAAAEDQERIRKLFEIVRRG